MDPSASWIELLHTAWPAFEKLLCSRSGFKEAFGSPASKLLVKSLHPNYRDRRIKIGFAVGQEG